MVQKLRLLLIKMIREEVKTNQMRLDHEVRFHHEQWTVWGVSKTKTQDPRGGGTPLKGLNGDVQPARVCFSGFLSQTGYRFYQFLS